ncbi:protein REVEILLE 2-like [Gossypium australe]|uniref:Protein REVEILLE 2-like n=1 Tax=Gossypium australe TaxID=47621 RepID=A0A5B6VZX3_9ROSI|nr:protein REVEILLE 2-like [Gossypium australe]
MVRSKANKLKKNREKAQRWAIPKSATKLLPIGSILLPLSFLFTVHRSFSFVASSNEFFRKVLVERFLSCMIVASRIIVFHGYLSRFWRLRRFNFSSKFTM